MNWIVFGEDWGSHPSSTQHLFKHILQQDDVTWVNSMGLRSPKLNSHDIRRMGHKLKSMLEPKEPALPIAGTAHITNDVTTISNQKSTGSHTFSQEPNTMVSDTVTGRSKPLARPQHIIHPQTVPVYSSKLIRGFNRLQLSRQLRSHTLDSTEDTILWLSLPSAVDMVGLCGESLSVYYCGDDFSSLAGVDHKIVAQMEAELSERCDLILTASCELAKKFPVGKTHLLEHGVDFPLFSTPAPRPMDCPEEKVMGFYGQLADWVDIDLLNVIADSFPDWTIQIIGAVHTETWGLLNRKNVQWHDAMPHANLAAYCQHWQIAMLPFRHCPQITHCNPLKLREYLASGTPIISTRFPAAEKYCPTVTLADNTAEFLLQLDHMISGLATQTTEQKAQAAREQQRLVQKESWEHKAQFVRMLIGQELFPVDRIDQVS